VLSLLAKQCALVMENAVLYARLKDEHHALKKAQHQIVMSEKLAAIAKLTAGACHEILNPLNIISGNLQLMALSPAISESMHRKLTVMQSQTDRIAVILKGLNQLAREPYQRIEPVNLNAVIEQVLASRGVELKIEGVKLVRDLSADLPLVTADPIGLAKVFFNLLSNARESTADDGILTITSKRRWSDSENEETVEVGIGDNGAGIPEEGLNQIFEPFFTTKTLGHHPGLGLTQVLAIVQEHGGSLSVDSVPGKGSLFTVRLPLCHRAAALGLQSAKQGEATCQTNINSNNK
jgi:signal transduction histidine kinase